MRFYLSFLLVFICVFATAQVPPMAIGGSQGIDVNRILVRNWLTTPIYTDTPSSPLSGSGWPGRGYLITVVKNESPCQNCPPKDTSLWVYTGVRWKRVGMDYVTRLVYGGQVSKASGQNLNYIIQPYGAFFNGDYRSSSTNKIATLTPKASDNTGRIDVLVLNRDSFLVKTGISKVTPQKPLVSGNEIEIASFYFKAFDTIPKLTGSSAKVSSIYRVAGIDSIYFTIDTSLFAIKDSIGISKNDTASMLSPYLRKVDTLFLSNRIDARVKYTDTAAMLNPYKFLAANGLTKDSTVFRLGGSLNQNTNINLNTRRLTIIGGTDTTRFFANGSLSIGATPSDSTYRFNVNGGAKMDSLVVDSLYAKFGSYLGTGVPFAPIEFRATSGGKMRIDLRPSSSAAWNSNWYGAITHNGTETDIFSANYGSLYLGSDSWGGGSDVRIGGSRNSPSIFVKNSGNILINTATDSTFKLHVNGRARISDTLTLSTSPATSDTTANDLLVINSSNGQVRRYTGAWYSVPLEGSDTLDFPSTNGSNKSDLTITVTGAADGDVVSLGVPNSVNLNHSCFTAWVSATDTVTVRFSNYGTGALDPVSATFKVKVFK